MINFVLTLCKLDCVECVKKAFDMPTLKDVTIEILKDLSPSASLEEIMYKINLAAQVMEGIQDAERGNVITTDELLKRVDAWAK